MCHHLTEAERERLRERATEREGDLPEDPIEESEEDAALVPTPSD